MTEALLTGGAALITVLVTAVCLAATIIPVIFVLKRLGNMSANNSRLLQSGVSANARLLQVGATGLTVNQSPQLALTMEVQPPPAPGYRNSAPAFTATAQVLVPFYAMARLVPGATIPVRFDPTSPSNVAVDFGAMGYA